MLTLGLGLALAGIFWVPYHYPAVQAALERQRVLALGIILVILGIFWVPFLLWVGIGVVIVGLILNLRADSSGGRWKYY